MRVWALSLCQISGKAALTKKPFDILEEMWHAHSCGKVSDASLLIFQGDDANENLQQFSAASFSVSTRKVTFILNFWAHRSFYYDHLNTSGTFMIIWMLVRAPFSERFFQYYYDYFHNVTQMKWHFFSSTSISILQQVFLQQNEK